MGGWADVKALSWIITAIKNLFNHKLVRNTQIVSKKFKQ
jgi:hypothetical protein